MNSEKNISRNNEGLIHLNLKKRRKNILEEEEKKKKEMEKSNQLLEELKTQIKKVEEIALLLT